MGCSRILPGSILIDPASDSVTPPLIRDQSAAYAVDEDTAEANTDTIDWVLIVSTTSNRAPSKPTFAVEFAQQISLRFFLAGPMWFRSFSSTSYMLRPLVSSVCVALTLCPLISFSAEIGSTEGFEPYLARRDGKWGYLQHAWGIPEKEWKTAIPFEYDWASTFNGLTSATVRKNGKYGLVDRKWRLIVPTEYDYAFPFQHGMAIVYRGGKYGAVDETGKLVVPIEYDDIYPFRDMGTAAAAKGDKCGVLNNRGHAIVPFDHSFSVTNGTGICGGYVPKVGWKYVDREGRPFARASFKTIDYHSDGVTGVLREDGRWELVDWATGKAILPGDYKQVAYDDTLKICVVTTDLGEGLYDVERGTWIVPAEYTDVNTQKDGTIRAVRKSGEKKMISFFRRDGSKLANGEFEDAGYFSNGLVEVQLNGKWGVLNADGKFAVPCDFEDRDHLKRRFDFYAVWVSGKGWGAFDKTGRQVLPYGYSNPNGEEPFVFDGIGKYSEVSDFSTETVGLLNTDFEWVVPPGVYKDFHVPSEGLGTHNYVPFKRGDIQGLYDLTARKEVFSGDLDVSVGIDYDHISILGKDGRWGIIDFITWKHHRPTGKFVYDDFDHRTKTFTVVNASQASFAADPNQRFGVVDLNGKFIIPLEYEKLSKNYDEGLYVAYKNGRVGFIDFNGKTVVPFKFEPIIVGELRTVLDVGFVEGHIYLRQKGEMVLVDTKGKIQARESQFTLPQIERLIFRQVGNMGIYAAESESDRIQLMVGDRLYERPGGSIDNEKDELYLREGRLAVYRNGKWGYLNEDGIEVIPCQFEEAGKFNGGTAYVKHEGKFHIINHSGALLTHNTQELSRLRRKK
jgi:hypothetical protein